MLDFPNSPPVGQQYSVGSKTWAWNGFAWDAVLAFAPGIKASQFGAVPGVQLDQSAKLQAAWDAASAAGAPFIVDGVYWMGLNDRIYPDGLVRKVGLQAPSNSLMVFAPGAELKALPNAEAVGYTINFYLADNVELRDARVTGERDQHIGSAGESGNLLNIVNCTNVYIHRAKVRDAWGDGIYLGTEYYSATNKQTENVTLFECESLNSRRNNLSVTSGRNIQVLGGFYKNANGTFPQAGIDLEPEGQGATPLVCENWVLDGVDTGGNIGAGVLCYTNSMPDGSTVDIRVMNHRDVGSVVGARVQHGTTNVKGRILFQSPDWSKLKANGLISKTVTNGPVWDILDPLVRDCGDAQSSINGLSDSAFLFLREVGDPTAPVMGNTNIVRARVRDSRTVKKTSCAFYSVDQATNNAGALSNCTLDLVEDGSASPWRFALFKKPDATVRITCAEATPLIADETRSENYFNKVVIPENATSSAAVILGQMRQPLSGKVLSTTWALGVQPQPDARIFPIGSALGKKIYSFTPGATIELTPIGAKDWVASVTGTWVSE